MAALHADRRGQFREPQIERHQLDFGAALHVLVGEGLPDAVGRRIGGVGKADLVMLVVGVAHQYRIASMPAANGRYSPLPVTLSWRASMRVPCPSPSAPGMA